MYDTHAYNYIVLCYEVKKNFEGVVKSILICLDLARLASVFSEEVAVK